MEENGEIYAVTVVYTGHFTIGAKNKREAAVLAASLPPVMAEFPNGYV